MIINLILINNDNSKIIKKYKQIRAHGASAAASTTAAAR